MDITRADAAGDEPGDEPSESSHSSGAAFDDIAASIRKRNPDDLKRHQQAATVAFEASGLSLAAFAEAHPDMIEKLLPERPATPWYKISGFATTDEDLVKFKLKWFRAYLTQCIWVTPDQRKDMEFLINYYENGGSPPPPGTTRWVRGGQFAPEGFSETAVKNGENQVQDAGLGGGYHQYAS